MRVLFQLLDEQAAGGQRVAASVATALAADGATIGVVLPERGPALDLFSGCQPAVHLLDTGSLRRPPVVRRLASLGRQYDVLYSHTSIPGEILGGLSAQAARRPHVIHRHTTPHLSTKAQVRAAQRLLWKYVARRATVIAVSTDTARAMRKLAGAALDSFIIPNGAPDDVNPADGSAHDPIRVGMVGRLDPQKGMDVFLDAIERSERRFESIIGTTQGGFESFGAEVVRRADELGVRIKMPVNDGVAFLRELDIVVIPSRWEGSPLTLFEAMALGKPIIASAVPGIEEVVAPTSAAVLVRRDDPVALASAIDRLVIDEVGRMSYAERARRASQRRLQSDAAQEAAQVIVAAVQERFEGNQ